MVTPLARIRAFQPSDDKDVRFIAGKAAMEPLAIANVKGAPVRLGCGDTVLTSSLSMHESHHLGYLGWPVMHIHPVYAVVASPGLRNSRIPPSPSWVCLYGCPNHVLGRLVRVLSITRSLISDLRSRADGRFNRQPIEEKMQQVLHRPDLAHIESWYSRSPSSGVWILEFGDKFVGLIALDASLDSTSTAAVSGKDALTKRGNKVEYSKGTSYTAVIRHFYVDEGYRPAGAQHDLLQFALKHAFENDPAVQEIQCDDTPLRKYVSDALKKAGFQLEWQTEKIGILGWQNSVRTLSREKWKSAA